MITHPFPRMPSLCLAALLPLAAALPARAQAPDTSLDARMRAFVREIAAEPNTGLAAFFPRRGDWTWVQTMRGERGGERVGVWRFPGAETVRAIGAGGPACNSFDVGGGEIGPFEGSFGMQTRMHPLPWRRVRGNRFVPRGASAGSPVFVEWRREDGEWVVSAFGDEDVYFPRVLGWSAGPFSRDTSLVPEDAAFAPADWYTITLDGRRYARYGNPRPLEGADRARLLRLGVLHRVSVYVERGTRPEWPDVVYLPVAPGRFQPYETPAPVPCR